MRSENNTEISENATPQWAELVKSIRPSLHAYMDMKKKQLENILKFSPLSFAPETFEKKGKFFSGEVESEKGGLYSDVVSEILSLGDEVKMVPVVKEENVDREEGILSTDELLYSREKPKTTGGFSRATVKAIQKVDFSQTQVNFELVQKEEIEEDIEIYLGSHGTDRHIGKINTLVQDVLDPPETDEQKEEREKKIPLRMFLSGDFSQKEYDPLHQKKEGYTEKQNEAFQVAKSPKKTPVLFIQGGPGTGKTKVEVDIIQEHVQQGQKVLLLSHSNKGVQVPAKAFAKILGKKSQKYIHVAGNSTEKIDTSLHKNRLHHGAPIFPKQQFQAINDLTDEEIHEYFKEQGEFLNETPETGKIIEERNRRKELIKEKYEEKWKKHMQKMEKKLHHPGLTVSTFGSLLNDEILAGIEFDVVIIDEATRMRSPELLQALQKAGKQIIFVGDPTQLGNIPLSRPEQTAFERVVSERNDENWYYGGDRFNGQDLLKRFEDGPFTDAIRGCKNPEEELPYVFLDKNFRSRPNIVKILSELMYEGKLKPGREGEENEGIVKWYDTQFAEAKERSAGTSKRNTGEAKFIGEKVLGMLLRKENPVAPEDIAVIATYSEQAKLIRRYLKRKLFFDPKKTKNKDLYERLEKNIATVDAFQGDERKVVFVSMTRSNDEGEIGFLDEERRMGVAIGRAQEELYLVGNVKTVAGGNGDGRSGEFFEKLHTLVEENGEIETVNKKTA